MMSHKLAMSPLENYNLVLSSLHLSDFVDSTTKK